MKIYMAPMEGVTGYTYRNTYRKYYADADQYITPFISPHEKLGQKVINEILPENNADINVVPQIMAGNCQEVIGLCNLISPYGYSELNLNTGCPSGTVVTKRRGSGLLKDWVYLDDMFEEIFDNISDTDINKISVKTRIGWQEPDEWEQLAKTFGRYPFSEVIIHTRVREEFYKGATHPEAMDIAREYITAPIIYNGDIFSIEDAEKIRMSYPWISGLMIGRGVLRNPQLIDDLKHFYGDTEDWNSELATKPDNDRLYAFLSDLYDTYLELFGSDINTLYHMKEIWSYMGDRFSVSHPKEYKTILRTKSTNEYNNMVRRILL